MKRIIELRAAEGGNDAKNLIQEMSTAYHKFCTRL